MRRRSSGNLRNLPKLRLVSRRHHASMARRLAQTAPQFLDEAVAASHLQPIYQAGHLRQDWQLRVDHTSFVSDQVLCKGMLSIPYYKRTLLNLLPLPLQLIFSQRISLKIQHPPPRCFNTQTLVTCKMTTSLKMPQHFIVPMGEHGHILLAQLTIKMAGYIRSI